MKILLIGNYIADQQQSMLRFANMLESGLTKIGHQVKIIRPEPVIYKMISLPENMNKWLGYMDKFIIFPNTINKAIEWADIVHICDHSNAIYTKYLKNIPHVVTCHDLLAIKSALEEVPENLTSWTGKQLQKMILTGLNQSQKVACVSEMTQKDLLKFSELSSERTSVIYNGFNYSYTVMNQEQCQTHLDKLGIDNKTPFIFHIGANNWYKNRLGVLKIFAYILQKKPELGLKLVMVGEPFYSEMQYFIKQNNLSEKVTELIDINNDELNAVYSSAKALLFPSFQEGFGWPIIEAQSCGCPVFTTNLPPMTEVGGNGAIYIDPYQPELAAEIIINSLDDLTEVKNKGFINIQRFNTDRMIQSYLTLYQQVIEEQNSTS